MQFDLQTPNGRVPAVRRVGGAQVGAIRLQEPQHHAVPAANGRVRQRRPAVAIDSGHVSTCVVANRTQSDMLNRLGWCVSHPAGYPASSSERQRCVYVVSCCSEMQQSGWDEAAAH